MLPIQVNFAVLGRHVVQPVGGAQSARAGHVLRHGTGIAGEMARDVARQHASEEVIAGAGFMADHDVEGFAAVEIGSAFVRRLSGCLASGDDRKQQQRPAH
jgi:hypothetical protein